MNESKRPIAVFDSGAGGISVLKELVRLMPKENYIYFGDSLNAPYGTKSTEEVRKLTLECIGHLTDMGAKAAVIACNTATSAAVRALRKLYQMPVIGIEPAVKPAALWAEGGRVLVMATQLTLREEKLHALTEKYKDMAEIILLPCSQLVEFVESGIISGTEIDEYLNSILSPYKDKANALVLGCTHFPLARDAIQKAVGKVRLFDGGPGVARETKRQLEQKGLLCQSDERSISFLSSMAGKEDMYKRLFYM